MGAIVHADVAQSRSSSDTPSVDILFTNQKEIWVTAEKLMMPGTSVPFETIRWAKLVREKKSPAVKWTFGIALALFLLGAPSSGPYGTTQERAASEGAWIVIGIVVAVSACYLYLSKRWFSLLVLEGSTWRPLWTTTDLRAAEACVAAINRRVVQLGGGPPPSTKSPEL